MRMPPSSGSANAEHIADHREKALSRCGSCIAGYWLTNLLGVGSFGAVYHAVRDSDGKPFSAKVLNRKSADAAKAIERMRREALSLARIDHKNVIYAEALISTIEGEHLIVMEYAPGRTLAELLREGGPMPAQKAARIAREVADGLAALHRAGLVHRDVKPANIMVDESKGELQVKLLDLGSVRVPDVDEKDRLTRRGAVIGTPSYMPPEQLIGADVWAAADLYALGVVLYEMLVGRTPFKSTQLPDILQEQFELDTRRDISGVPLNSLVARLLQKKPNERPQTESVIDALDRFLALEVETPYEHLSSDLVLDELEPPTTDSLAPATPLGRISLALRKSDAD